MPFTEGSTGRDHNPKSSPCGWRAAASRAGRSSARHDEIGYKAAENPQTVYDLNATILHLLGLDHKRLTYHYSGRDFRLTDVSGEVIKAILA